ncbi:MAG: tocopherol cyclase family protein [Clostridium sp.]|uniref:tocopherol cyclase family protein n=1 Tax=Clostridium sp. TaxID=1506 RepID=UPI003064E7E1
MNNFHGASKKKNFFEGWYFKHQKDNNTIAFIPGINIDDKGNRLAFIQVITNTNSYNINYPFDEFLVDNKSLEVVIGNNIFSERGIKLNIESEDISISGSIKYGEITPIKYDIMGPFSVIPFMECNHGVISLYHELSGEIFVNCERINLSGGRGYIEKDWGSSFPKTYHWVQCNDFKKDKCCVMVSIADIPFMGLNFKGCICVVYYKGKEYRFATYNGVKIINCTNKLIELKRGKYRLEIQVKGENPQKLLAPNRGEMSRTIHENAACVASFKFYASDKLLFNLSSNNCSLECVEA